MKDDKTDKSAQFDSDLQRWYRRVKPEQPCLALDDKMAGGRQ
ncbi:hypothetical protein [Shewanella canadensis]|nr:hypothetical protein [Shewanella canadensis]